MDEAIQAKVEYENLYKSTIQAAKDKVAALIQKIRDFTLDERQISFKRVLVGQQASSEPLFMYYTEKLTALEESIKLGFTY